MCTLQLCFLRSQIALTVYSFLIIFFMNIHWLCIYLPFYDNKLVFGWLLHFVHQFQWSVIQVDSSFMWPVDNSFPLSFIYDVIPGIFTSFAPNSIMILFILNISSGTIYLEWPWICHIRIEIIHWVIFRHGIPHLPWYLLGYFPSAKWRPSGLRKTTFLVNSLAHRTTWLRSDFNNWFTYDGINKTRKR